MLDLALAPLRSGPSLALVPVGLAIGTLQRGVANTLTPTSFSTINNDSSNHDISSSANVTEVVVGVVTSGACVRLFRLVDELGLGAGQGPAVVVDAYLPPLPIPASSLHNYLAGQGEEEGEGGQSYYALTAWRALRRSIERVGVGFGRGGRLLVPCPTPSPSSSLSVPLEQLTTTTATMTTTQLLLPGMPPSMQLLLNKRGGGGSGGWTPLSVWRALAHSLTHPHHSTSPPTAAVVSSHTNILHAATVNKTSTYGNDHFGIAPGQGLGLGLAPGLRQGSGLVYTVDTPLTAMFAYAGLLTPPPPPPPPSPNTTEMNQFHTTSATASTTTPVLALAVRLQGVLNYALAFALGDKKTGLGLGQEGGEEGGGEVAEGGGQQKGREGGGGDGLRQALALACVRLRRVAVTVVGAGSIGDLLQTQGLGLGAVPANSGHDDATATDLGNEGEGDGEEVILPCAGVEDVVGVYVPAEALRRLVEWTYLHQEVVIATDTGTAPGLRSGLGSMSGLGLGLGVGISPTTAGNSDGDNSTCSSSSSSSSSLAVTMLVSRLLWRVLGSEAISSSSSSSSSSLRNSPGAGLGLGLGFGFGRLGGSGSSSSSGGSSGDVSAVDDVGSGSGFAVEACLSAVLASVLQDLSQSSSLGHCNTDSNGASPGPSPSPSSGLLSAVAVSHCLLASIREQQALFQTLVYAPLAVLLPQVHIDTLFTPSLFPPFVNYNPVN